MNDGMAPAMSVHRACVSAPRVPCRRPASCHVAACNLPSGADRCATALADRPGPVGEPPPCADRPGRCAALRGVAGAPPLRGEARSGRCATALRGKARPWLGPPGLTGAPPRARTGPVRPARHRLVRAGPAFARPSGARPVRHRFAERPGPAGAPPPCADRPGFCTALRGATGVPPLLRTGPVQPVCHRLLRIGPVVARWLALRVIGRCIFSTPVPFL